MSMFSRKRKSSTEPAACVAMRIQTTNTSPVIALSAMAPQHQLALDKSVAIVTVRRPTPVSGIDEMF